MTVRLAGDHFPAVGDAQGASWWPARSASGAPSTSASPSWPRLPATRCCCSATAQRDDPAVASYRLADWGREDIDAALAWCRARAPELPRYFVGHSIGAQLLGLAGQASGLSGAAFVAGSFPYWRRWRGRQRWQMFGLFCVAVPLRPGCSDAFPAVSSASAAWICRVISCATGRAGGSRTTSWHRASDCSGRVTRRWTSPSPASCSRTTTTCPGLRRKSFTWSMPRRIWSCVARDGPRGGRAFRAVPQRGVAEGVARLLQEAARRGVSRVRAYGVSRRWRPGGAGR